MHNTLSIRPFIGAKDFAVSRSFYRDLSFQERIIDSQFSYFQLGEVGFYLQDYYVKEWIDNLMVFMEVSNADDYHAYLMSLDLPEKYTGVKLSAVRSEVWGKECFLHDPSGVLWHFGTFTDNK